MEVPPKDVYPPPGMDEVMLEPGANRSIMEATSEKFETASDFVVDDTATEVEIQAGDPIRLVRPPLPVAMTVAMALLRRLSIAFFVPALVPSQ